VALGQSTASGNLSFAHGISTASEEYSFASGDGSISDGYASSAFNASNASGDFSFACGQGSVASANNTIAMGFESGAGEVYGVAIGTRAKSNHIGASVESDSELTDVVSTATNEKTFRFANGYRFLGGSATFSAGVTVEGTLTADHIHGNLAGSVYAHVRAGENLAKGDPVYISGSHGSGETLIPIVSKADASNAAKMPAVGIMDAALANNANGHMVITGTITQLNTNAYAVNSVLYVATGGGFTATPPAANSQAVAIVERSNTNNGAVIVKVNGLASSGGNGASDANKLVRFTSTGGISQTGGTMTDMTYAGSAAFTSTTRPTSAGTGTPAATSLMTRDDVDLRAIQSDWRSWPMSFAIAPAGCVVVDSGNTSGAVNVLNYSNNTYPLTILSRAGDSRSTMNFDRRHRISFDLFVSNASGAGEGWVVCGETFNKSTVTNPDKKSFGIKITSSGVALWVHDGTSLNVATATSVPSTETLCNIYLEYWSGTLSGTLNGTALASATSGPSGAGTNNATAISFQAKTGATNERCRFGVMFPKSLTTTS
jgi:hypothetical protein